MSGDWTTISTIGEALDLIDAAGAPILAALAEIGYDGWYEIEIFSDGGLFGTSYEDSLWRMPALDLVRAARDAFLVVVPAPG